MLLDVPVEVGLRRAHGRNAAGGLDSQARFEQEDQAFHQRVRQGYLELARVQPERIRIVDGARTEQEVYEEVSRLIAACLKERS